jgi:hypothetical protein
MKKELHALRGGDPEQLKLQIADLEQQLTKRNQLLFGDKSEKRSRSERTTEKTPQTGHGPRQQPLRPDPQQVDHGRRARRPLPTLPLQDRLAQRSLSPLCP